MCSGGGNQVGVDVVGVPAWVPYAHSRVSRAGTSAILLCGVASLAALALDDGGKSSLAIAAFGLGWTQLGGLCGTAHVNTMTFMWRARHSQWLLGTSAYTMSGLVSSSCVGLILAFIGRLTFGPYHIDRLWWLIGLGVCVLLAETRLLRWLQLPALNGRTERAWVYQFGWTTAAAMWGFHIGIGFATVTTYGGFWLIVAIIVVHANLMLGCCLMAAYWVGRTMPLWTVPFASDHGMAEPQHYLMKIKGAHQIGVAVIVIVLAVLATTSLGAL
jgi:cytochrome c biogenesis protein CcdA